MDSQLMTEPSLTEAVDAIIDGLTDEMATLMEAVVMREIRDRHNPQASTPEDYARMAWDIRHGTRGRG